MYNLQGLSSFVRDRLGDDIQRTWIYVYALAAIGISIFSLYFFLSDKLYFIGSDAYSYLSAGDSIRESGRLLDMTTDPAKLPSTTQFGVSFVHVFLSYLGIGAEGRLVSIVVLNYLLHLSAVYPLYKIGKRVGLSERLPMVALLGAYIGAWHIYFFQLKAINDGIFNSAAIWLTYLILVGLQSYPELGEGWRRWVPKGWTAHLLAICILAAVAVLFRINIILILGSAFLSAIVLARFRYALWTIVFLGACVVSLGLFFIWIETAALSGTVDSTAGGLLTQLTSKAKAVVFGAVPNLLVKGAGLPVNFIYGVFALGLFSAIVSGFKKRDPGILFLAITSLSAMFFLVFVGVQPYRLLLYIFPFMYLLILIPKQLRPIGYMFVALVLISSLHAFYKGFEREPVSEYYLYLNENEISLPESNPLLISQSPRHPYFFLDKARTFQGDLTADHVTSDRSIFVLGDQEFVTDTLGDINELTEAAGYIYETRSLTPGYQDIEGNTLIQVHGFASSTN